MKVYLNKPSPIEDWEIKINFDDSEEIEWYLTETCGHRLGDIHWMSHQNPEIVTP